MHEDVERALEEAEVELVHNIFVNDATAKRMVRDLILAFHRAMPDYEIRGNGMDAFSVAWTPSNIKAELEQ